MIRAEGEPAFVAVSPVVASILQAHPELQRNGCLLRVVKEEKDVEECLRKKINVILETAKPEDEVANLALLTFLDETDVFVLTEKQAKRLPLDMKVQGLDGKWREAAVKFVEWPSGKLLTDFMVSEINRDPVSVVSDAWNTFVDDASARLLYQRQDKVRTDHGFLRVSNAVVGVRVLKGRMPPLVDPKAKWQGAFLMVGLKEAEVAGHPLWRVGRSCVDTGFWLVPLEDEEEYEEGPGFPPLAGEVDVRGLSEETAGKKLALQLEDLFI